jgi:hypothetical protein
MMGSTTAVDSGDEWVNRYEELRANALGQRSRAIGMLLFLQQGMNRWLRRLNNENLSAYTPSPFTGGTPASCGVAVILADAVLEIARPILCLKEEFNG